MSYQAKPGQGSLFKNDRKETERHPDYKGSVVLPDGTEHWLSAWIKEGKRGKFMSVSIGQEKQPKPDVPRGTTPEFEDDIPF